MLRNTASDKREANSGLRFSMQNNIRNATIPDSHKDITKATIEGQLESAKRETEHFRPFTTPNTKTAKTGSTVADWSLLRIGSPPTSKRFATSHSMRAAPRDLSEVSPSPGSIRPVTRGVRARQFENDDTVCMPRPATRSGISSRAKTVNTLGNDFGFDFWRESDSTLPAHFRLKATFNEQPKARMSNISIHLPEHAPASVSTSKSLQFLARYKEVSSAKYRIGSKSLRLQNILEILSDIATAQELECPALSGIQKDLADEVFSHEVEGHDSKGCVIPMTWKTLCGNLRCELEDANLKLSVERSQNEALQLQNQAISAQLISNNEKMSAAQVKNDLMMLEQKAHLEEVQKQKMKLQELSASHQELEAAFWSSDVTRRAYKSSLVHDANIQMSTQQYIQKSEDAFEQLLMEHKQMLAKAHEIQKDSYAKDDTVTRLLNEIKESKLNHARQESLLVVYQDRVNNSVAKAIYDAVEDDLTQKNMMVIKLEERIAMLNNKLCALEKEIESKSFRGRKDIKKVSGSSEVINSLAGFKHQDKTASAATSKIQNVGHHDRFVEEGDPRDEVCVPNFFVDGLSRRPGRIGRMVNSLRKDLETQGEPLSWIQLINQCIINIDGLELDLKDVGKQLRELQKDKTTKSQ